MDVISDIESKPDISSFGSCPVPNPLFDRILLAHGSGGRLTHELIQKMFLPEFDNRFLRPLHDGAVVSLGGVKVAFTTDSYVVHPTFFPGGDIGELAVNGTVNDLAMCGARPMYLSAGVILEEGFPISDLERIVHSMRIAAVKAGVSLVTGDTKVVDRGKGDGIYINTSGIGVVMDGCVIASEQVEVGDKIIVSGTIADHGIAIMLTREGMEFESQIRSDTAPLNRLVELMLNTTRRIHMLRDPTRGGIASALNEIAKSSNSGILVQEDSVPINEQTAAACEVLGLDPLYVANEGKLLAFVHPGDAEVLLRAMRTDPLGGEAAIIGEVVSDHRGLVVLNTQIGGTRLLDMMSGDQLPRIC